jgi:hypothetical protein
MVSLSRSLCHLNERKPKPELSASQGVPYKSETRLTADRANHTAGTRRAYARASPLRRYVLGIQLLGLSVEVTSTLDAFLRRLLQGVRERVVPPARQFQPVGARISFAVAVAVRLGMQPPHARVQAAQRRIGKIPVTGVEAEALVNHHRFVNQPCGLAATWARDGKFPAGQTLPGLPPKLPKYKRPLEQIEGPCFANSD